MLNPWVCVEGAGTPNDNLFSWPTVANWDVKCYADNEVETGWPANMNYYYGYFEDTKGQGDPKDYRLYLSLRQWGPDGQLTDVKYDEKVFFPVMDDESDYVW